jgi:hypothetical protein
MDEDIKSSHNIPAELPKGQPSKTTPQDNVDAEGHQADRLQGQKPRVKGSHRNGTPPKIKWL